MWTCVIGTCWCDSQSEVCSDVSCVQKSCEHEDMATKKQSGEKMDVRMPCMTIHMFRFARGVIAIRATFLFHCDVSVAGVLLELHVAGCLS